jgi:hypothetical protein
MTKARGHWMGNRGILHDREKRIVRAFKSKAWLTCLLEFRGRKRQVMSAHRYTELFFIDEATAFAAEHRPCFECRRNDFLLFKALYLKGNPQYHYDPDVSIREIDKILHQERIDCQGRKITRLESSNAIPDGVFVLVKDKPYLIARHQMYCWSPQGYVSGFPLPDSKKLTVLTPFSVVNTFRAGYTPQMAISSVQK